MLSGTVKWYNESSGTGVITPDDGSRDVLFLKSAIEGGGPLHSGQQVEYELFGNEDEPEARRVVPL